MKETFADRLKQSMDRRGFKQVDLIRLAAEQGVKLGKSHMSQYVSGKTVPRTELLRFLAENLQVDEDWLAGRTPEGEAEEPDGTRPAEVLSAGEKFQETEKTGGTKMREFKKSSKLNDVL